MKNHYIPVTGIGRKRMEGISIVREIIQSNRFKHVTLIGGMAANMHILHLGHELPKDLVTDYEVRIYDNNNNDQEEVSRVVSILKEILSHHKCQFPENDDPATGVKIDGMEFNFLINECNSKGPQEIDGIPVAAIQVLRLDYVEGTYALQDDVDYIMKNHPEDKDSISYLREKIDRYRRRLSLLE